MRFGSVCSGIEAASVAWEPLGWECAFVSEIEKFPCAVLAHHYPDTPNLGDMTADDFIDRARATGPIDLLVGGTPCQSFSVAGLRGGLADDRGNLALRYMQIVDGLRPRWVVWENVPGVLSSGGGRDFGAILGALVELGYGFAYRILDAVHFGVPQRRRRVFVVGHLGGWAAAAAVLFERHSLQGHPPPRRETRQGATPLLEVGARTNGDGYRDGDGIGKPGDPMYSLQASKHHGVAQETAGTLGGGSGSLGWAPDTERMTFIPECALSLNAHGQRLDGESETFVPMAVAFTQNQRDEANLIAGDGQTAGALAANEGMKQQNYVAFDLRGRDGGAQMEGPHDTANLRAASGGSSKSYVAGPMVVRRLVPEECEKLQGFEPGYTRIPYHRGEAIVAEALGDESDYRVKATTAADCPDGPRYKALGNSMAVPCMRWIGQRIQSVEDIL